MQIGVVHVITLMDFMKILHKKCQESIFYSVNVDNQELMQEVQATKCFKRRYRIFTDICCYGSRQGTYTIYRRKTKEEMKATINQLLEN